MVLWGLLTMRGMKEPSGDLERFQILIQVVVTWACSFVKVVKLDRPKIYALNTYDTLIKSLQKKKDVDGNEKY